ncbi:hypothetical protein Tco_0153721 [Tanacetum coccineum]
MAALKFTKTHNLVAFLEKPDESEGFEQIVDFLNAYTIKYALTCNPIIYTSCIEQFWATVKVKTINEEKQLQAIVDRKKVVITESTIRRDLHLEDAEGGVNLDVSQDLYNFCDHNLEIWSHHKRIFVTPSHTKKVFGNMKREGKGFSGRKKQPRRKQRKDTEVPQHSGPTEPIADEAGNEESVPTHYNDPLLSGEDRNKLYELMELCTTLQSRVLDLETTKTQAKKIASLKKRVKKLERKRKSKTLGY